MRPGNSTVSVEVMTGPELKRINTISCASRYPPAPTGNVHVESKENENNNLCFECKRKILQVQTRAAPPVPQQVVQQLYPDNPDVHDRVIVVESKPNEWWLTVPLEHKGEVVYVNMLGDVGADTCGTNEKWAIAKFSDEIQTTTQTVDIETAGGIVTSNKFVNLSFKRWDGLRWTSRFYLLPDLNVQLLASKTLLA